MHRNHHPTANEHPLGTLSPNGPSSRVSDIETPREQILNAATTICLVSIMKSGTHWLRYLFANYVNLQTCGSSGDVSDVPPVSYDGLQSRFSPIDRRLWLRNPALPIDLRNDVYPFHGITNVFWQHVDQNLNAYRGKMVFIYRNPLDYAVSRFFYDRKLWAEEGRDVTNVGTTLRWSLSWYGEGMQLMKALSKATNRVVSISYEELKSAPVVALGPIFRWAGMPYHVDCLRRAVDLSDARVVSEEERLMGKAIVGPTETGYFVRDGSVGQWKNHFGERDLMLAEEILSEYDIGLPQFILTV